MKIVLAHNSYQFRGGEDQVFEDERWLLKKNGHEVVSYCRDNSETDSSRRFGLAMKTVWSRQSYNELMSLLQAERPDLIHFHNTFPLVSPSAYYAAKRLGIPVVQTLHNYRLACPGAVMLQGGEICDACVGKRFAWNAVRHRCYRNSTAASLVTTAMLATHWSWRTWQDVVTKYIALTEFGRQTMVRAGISDDQIHVKPNFVRPDPGMGTGDGDYAIFVGRLSEEKGIDVLLDAWRDESLPRLKIVGEGPLEDLVHQAIREGAKIEYINQQPHDLVFSLIARSRFLVFPSIWNV